MLQQRIDVRAPSDLLRLPDPCLHARPSPPPVAGLLTLGPGLFCRFSIVLHSRGDRVFGREKDTQQPTRHCGDAELREEPLPLQCRVGWGRPYLGTEDGDL